MALYLGIDTSNYTTSAALFDGAAVLKNRKLPLPVAQGEKGLRQSDAVFHHTRQLPELLAALLPGRRLSAIGVSVTPRAAEGSYMPCFLVGRGHARVLGAALGAPVWEYSHQQGHIAAALYSAGRLELLHEKFIAFHVSGGTTEAVLVTPGGAAGPRTQLLAQSLDLKAGQLIDRVGVALGLEFPCGPALDRLAQRAPRLKGIRPSTRGADVSLSGVENQCMARLRQGQPPEMVARFCVQSVLEALRAMGTALLAEQGALPVLFSGGVSGNSLLREELGQDLNGIFAAPEFSSDNGAGAAVLAGLAQED